MATYDITVSIPSKMKSGDVLNCPYSGTAKSLTLRKGTYLLEAWGAQGGYRSSADYGGKGGYAAGTLTLAADTTVYLYAGGAGNTGGTDGGFNGGGARYNYPGGGGASDIRLRDDSLYSRVIVAGGGGSCGAVTKNGMYGGGTAGGIATQSYGSYGYGGTQTGHSTTVTMPAAKPTVNTSANYPGGFGYGGYGIYRSSGYGGAGGGGWYGGCGSYPDSSGDDDRGGGGGSGFVWQGINAPNGFLLTTADYLTDASTIAGNASITDPDGATATGHSGDGYVRITAVLVEYAPETPDNLRKTAEDYDSLTIAWDASNEATGYQIYKDGILMATTASTAYTATGLHPAESHVYSVAAYNADGASSTAEITAAAKFAHYAMIPVIIAVSISPQTVQIGQSFVISVSVTDEIKILQPIYCYTGEAYAGEI